MATGRFNPTIRVSRPVSRAGNSPLPAKDSKVNGNHVGLANRRRRRLLSFAVCAAVVLPAPSAVMATPPRPPARIDLSQKEIRGTLPGGKGEIAVEVAVVVDEHVKSIQLVARLRRLGDTGTADAAGKPETAQTIFDTKLAPPKKEKERIPGGVIRAKVDGPGTYELEIRLRGQDDSGDGFSDRVLRNIVVDGKGTFKVVTARQVVEGRLQDRLARFNGSLRKAPDKPRIELLFGRTVKIDDRQVKPIEIPANRHLIAPPADLSDFFRKHTVDSSRSPKDHDPITVRGRLVFMDIDGVLRPLVNVSVNVWDDDTFGDEHLGVTGTDWNGNWSLSVNSDDGWLQDGRDIYYSFKLENTRLRTRGCGIFSGAYEWSSTVHDDLSDGTVLDFGTQTGVEDPNSMQIFATLNLGWSHVTVAGGRDPGFVDSCFPSDGTYFDGAVNVMASDNDGPDSITHEYGHALMDLAYAGGGGDPSPGGNHGFGDCGQNQSLSWSEGWATGFMLSARPDGRFNPEGTEFPRVRS